MQTNPEMPAGHTLVRTSSSTCRCIAVLFTTVSNNGDDKSFHHIVIIMQADCGSCQQVCIDMQQAALSRATAVRAASSEADAGKRLQCVAETSFGACQQVPMISYQAYSCVICRQLPVKLSTKS